MTINQLQLIITEAIKMAGEMIYGDTICSVPDGEMIRRVLLKHFRENGINIDLIDHTKDINRIYDEGVKIAIDAWM